MAKNTDDTKDTKDTTVEPEKVTVTPDAQETTKESAENVEVSRKSLRVQDHAKKVHGKIKNLKVWQWGIIAAVIVAIVAVIVIIIITFSDFTKGDIKSVGLYPTKVSKDVTDNSVQSTTTFKKGEPILVAFDYEVPEGVDSKTYVFKVIAPDVQEETTVTNVVNEETGETTQETVKQAKVVRNGSFPVTISDDSGRASRRFISIVSSSRTALDPGKYVFELLEENGEDNILAKKTFTITDESAE